jgi:hypothetical protein
MQDGWESHDSLLTIENKLDRILERKRELNESQDFGKDVE